MSTSNTFDFGESYFTSFLVVDVSSSEKLQMGKSNSAKKKKEKKKGGKSNFLIVPTKLWSSFI